MELAWRGRPKWSIVIFTAVPCISIQSKSFTYQMMHNRVDLKEYCNLCIFIVRVHILLLFMYSYCSSMYSYCCLCILIVVYVFLDAATLTEVFPCFFIGCKANARAILAKAGHGPHSSRIVVLFYVLFVLYCSMYCLCVNVYCNLVTTQLQLTNISDNLSRYGTATYFNIK